MGQQELDKDKVDFDKATLDHKLKKEKREIMKTSKDEADEHYKYSKKQKDDFEDKCTKAWDKAIEKGNYDPSYQLDRNGKMTRNEDVPKFAKDRLDKRMKESKETVEGFESKQKERELELETDA